MTASDVVLEARRGITKRFPGLVANDGVDFQLRRGEVHCLLGENGAGKSTLMNVAFGLYQPDAGQLFVHGQSVEFKNSADAIARGIGMVHQHFQLIPVFTVVENIVLGNESKRGPAIDLDSARARIRALGQQYGLSVDPDAMVEDLSVGEQQRIELVKALYRDAEILILDEPTAVLTPGEVDEFFGIVRNLISQGKSIVFITHKLREVLAVADRITVMRHGHVVGTADPESATQQSLANLMVGRDVIFEIEKAPASPGAVRLSVEHLSVEDDRGITAVVDLSFEVRGGEIFGIAGVEGNGQRELVEAIAGMRTPRGGGHVTIDGVNMTHASPREVSEHGVGHVPEDRNKHGLIGPFTIADNLVLNTYYRRPFASFVRNQAAIDRHAEALVKEYDVRTTGIHLEADHLSGGNQQKVIIARELSGEVKVLLVAQPTRGLDVGSIEFIHRRIVALRESGTAILLVSAELDEILTLSDRIGVLYRGELVGEFDRADATREAIGLLMASGRAEAAAS